MLLAALALFYFRSRLAAETVISLEFDDNNASQFQARQLLFDRGMRATFFILSSRVDRSGYMSLAQLRTLQADGNEIGGHTLDHVDLTTVSAAEAERQICDDREALFGLGFDPVSFAYPFGAQNATVQSIVANCGYDSGRMIGGVGGCSSCPSAETLPPLNGYATRTRASVKVDTTLSMLQSYVTAAEDAGGGWVQIVFHTICDGSGCPTTSVNSPTLTAFLDWLAARRSRGTVVKTVREALGLSEPPPPPPPSDAVPPVTTIACDSGDCDAWSRQPVTVSFSATDEGSGVADLRYTLDGSEPTASHGGSCGGASSCEVLVSASATVKFRAFDRAGNAEATQSQAIRIDASPPAVAITAPDNGAVVIGSTTVRASASDPSPGSGVAEVRFFVDDRLIGSDHNAPYEVPWNSSAVELGPHRLYAEATDAAGNTTRSATITVLRVSPPLGGLDLGL